MYAEDKRSLLIVLQGRDAAGKDGTIRHVLSVMNPQGCTVTSFKVPSGCRGRARFPVALSRGRAQHADRWPSSIVRTTKMCWSCACTIWSPRKSGRDATRISTPSRNCCYDNHTQILKFFLHIDREEQLERFQKRIDDPAKHWKISDADYSERAYWDEYTAAFEDALEKCSTKHAPWFVIPSNHKWFRNLAIAQIVVDTLKDMNMQFPEPAVDMQEIRRKYHEAAE